MQKPQTFGADKAAANRAAYDKLRIEDRRFYWSTAWRAFRAGFLQRNPLCSWCQQPASQVDHVKPRVQLTFEQALSDEFCRAGCASCHAKYGAKRDRAERKPIF